MAEGTDSKIVCGINLVYISKIQKIAEKLFGMDNITSLERKRLRTWLKDFRLKVTGHRPFTEAIITAGGVNIREVDPDSMGSRLMDGLYFAGEILDLDGDTGGYNLQTAFSTGWLAGRSTAQRG